MLSFLSLPPEIIREILDYLPIKSLLNFGLTSKNNYAIQQCSLSRLRLGVFPSKLAGMISLMEATENPCFTHCAHVVLPKCQARTKEMVIRNQNIIVNDVVCKYRQTLKDLEISIWDFQESVAGSVARLKSLRRLSIRLDHPHIRHSNVDQSFWENPLCSTAWNSLYLRSGSKSALGRLQSLNLERAGITDYQLQRILENNPRILDLRVRKCLLLGVKTFAYLAQSELGPRLEIFHFTKHGMKKIDDRILEYIEKLSSLRVRL